MFTDNTYHNIKTQLRKKSSAWLVTGAAGFIGSHLVHALLELDQYVIGLDNFSSGRKENIVAVSEAVTKEQARRLHMIQADITEINACRSALEIIDFQDNTRNQAHYVLHHAAQVSVPASINDPVYTHSVNVSGFLNMLTSARDAHIQHFVYASSSAVYGNVGDAPHEEGQIGAALSPYALSKQLNESYADLYARLYGLSSTGLRYFNIFGPRQDPNGPYAAVIAKWTDAILNGQAATVFGDGQNTRDFCYIDDVVQANILAACAEPTSAPTARRYNIASGKTTTLNELYTAIASQSGLACPALLYAPARKGDIVHSSACIDAARSDIGFNPQYSLDAGLCKYLSYCTPNVASPHHITSEAERV